MYVFNSLVSFDILYIRKIVIINKPIWLNFTMESKLAFVVAPLLRQGPGMLKCAERVRTLYIALKRPYTLQF